MTKEHTSKADEITSIMEDLEQRAYERGKVDGKQEGWDEALEYFRTAATQELAQQARNGARDPNHSTVRPTARQRSSNGDFEAPKRMRRNSDAIESLAAAVEMYVKRHPGAGMEEVAHHLGYSDAKPLAPVRDRLLQEGRLRREGVRRATSYFPAKKTG